MPDNVALLILAPVARCDAANAALAPLIPVGASDVLCARVGRDGVVTHGWCGWLATRAQVASIDAALASLPDVSLMVYPSMACIPGALVTLGLFPIDEVAV